MVIENPWFVEAPVLKVKNFLVQLIRPMKFGDHLFWPVPFAFILDVLLIPELLLRTYDEKPYVCIVVHLENIVAHTHTRRHRHRHRHTHIHILIHIYTYIHIHLYLYTYIHIYIYTYTYIYIHIHMHIYIYIYGVIVYNHTYTHTFPVQIWLTYIDIISDRRAQGWDHLCSDSRSMSGGVK